MLRKNEVTGAMSATLNNSGTLLLMILLWVVCSLLFCFAIGYLTRRYRRQPSGHEGRPNHGSAAGTGPTP